MVSKTSNCPYHRVRAQVSKRWVQFLLLVAIVSGVGAITSYAPTVTLHAIAGVTALGAVIVTAYETASSLSILLVLWLIVSVVTGLSVVTGTLSLVLSLHIAVGVAASVAAVWLLRARSS